MSVQTQNDLGHGSMLNGVRIIRTAVALTENALGRLIGKRIEVELFTGQVLRGELADKSAHGWKIYTTTGPWNFSLFDIRAIGQFSH